MVLGAAVGLVFSDVGLAGGSVVEDEVFAGDSSDDEVGSAVGLESLVDEVLSATEVSAEGTDVVAGSSAEVGAAFPEVMAFPPPALPLVTAVL